MRTLQGRYLLLPTQRAKDLILGVIGRAMKHYDFQLHGDAFMSNHYSMLVSVPDAATLADVMNFINGNIARELGRLYDWPGKFWDRPYADLEIVDDDKLVERLAYVFSNSVKEGAVDRPERWPGAHCVRALCHGELRQGAWVDRTAMYEADRRRKAGEPELREIDFTTWYTVPMSPLPCWQDKTEAERRELCRAIARDVADEAREERARTGRRVQGVDHILAIDPHHRPEHVDRSPAPPCHASTKKARDAWRAEYATYATACRTARDRLGELGIANVEFPHGCIRPLRRRGLAPPAVASAPCSS